MRLGPYPGHPHPFREAPINRLVLWNIDLTLVDVSIVTREAYAEAFLAVTGRPLVKLTQPNGRPDSEIVFEMLAINGIVAEDDHLPRFLDTLATSFGARRRRLAKDGRMMPVPRRAEGRGEARRRGPVGAHRHDQEQRRAQADRVRP